MSVPPEQPPVYPPPGPVVEQPTAPLDPAAARPAPGAYRADPYVADPYAEDPRRAAWRLEGLRTALTIVGLIALIAAGLAVWALIRSDHNRRVVNQAPANTAALVGLTNRVDRLQSSIRSLSTAGGTKSATTQSLAARIAALQQSQQRLSSQVSHTASQVSHAGNTAQLSQLVSKEAALSAKVSQWVGKEAALSGQVSQLQGRVAQLAGQVAQLKGQTNGQTSTQTTTTGTFTTG